MIPFQTAITINRPVDQTFRFVADMNNSAQWMGGVTSATAVVENPSGIGSRYRVVGQTGPWRFDTLFEVTEYERDRKIAIRTASASPLQFEGRWVFEPAGPSATQLTASGVVQLSGLWRLLEPLFAGEVKNGEANELKKIKSLLEANA
ncbi:MAG: SRPBCC family protein [Chloroflexi bacterium]|nr:SRPBCC family protein [Chloroflexota bacterium]MBI3733598.1 SRPBCC family protein [Chloroflexota bacterium]